MAEVTTRVWVPVTVGVKLYTASAPGVEKPQSPEFHPAPEPESVAVTGVAQVSVVMLEQRPAAQAGVEAAPVNGGQVLFNAPLAIL